MVRLNSRRRVVIAAAGLALNVVMVACTRHASGERATRDSLDVNQAAVDTAGTPGAGAPTTTDNTAAAPSVNRDNDMGAVPEHQPTRRARTSARTESSYNEPSSDVSATVESGRRDESPSASASVSATPPSASANVNAEPAAGANAAVSTNPPSASAGANVGPVGANANVNAAQPSAGANANVGPVNANASVSANPPSVNAGISANAPANAANPAAPAANASGETPAAATPGAAAPNAGASATVCFADNAGMGAKANDDDMPSPRAETADVTRNPADSLKPATPLSGKQDSSAIRDDAAAPAPKPAAAPRDSGDNLRDNSMMPRDMNAPEPSAGRIVPCVSTGERRGVAAGTFLNDAQVAHAFIMANTIDSAVSFAAMRRTENSAVRAYAEMMIRDHTQANQQAAQVFDRLHLAPADNELSQQMLRDVAHLAELAPDRRSMVGVSANLPANKPAETRANVTTTTTTTTTANAPVNRDTLHLSNPFVAAVNMQPWSSLLNISADNQVSISQTTTSGSTMTSSRTVTSYPAVSANPNAAPAPANTAVSDFDRKYVDYQVDFHQKVLDAMDTRLIPWAGPEQRAILESARPTVAAHLEQARQLQRTLQQNGSATPSSTPNPY